ncbi:IS607 family transposase [Tuanshanicoccus lijuaniae]|uniref:IS607 family transposase n=1 Tax=Aerococcaceae bacterium zg-1292 TaxID=2774330 RepID=UPI00193891DB|nr:IS607 family transposase [Aerococcaceae bacterium zg-1292]QQA36494.1 IS607 family transposase [Aerococcaceae bacterium zg-1292]QQA37386.1 IS607 family transposase [Aerococcaceae bacterium zg-1292]QQA37911.1 IS607 family transposase [Aerococcaceae bacterium zg-1292]
MDKKQYLIIGEAADYIGKSPHTLRKWDKDGTLVPEHKTDYGTRYYSKRQLNEYLGIESKNKVVIGYARVSSKKQEQDLQRQIENLETYLFAQGKPFTIIKDIGSGINYEKKGLLRLMREVKEGRVDKIVVLYKDRLLRIGFELFQAFCDLYSVPIEIVDSQKVDEQQELTEDLVQVMTVFACRMQGRRSRRTKSMIQSYKEKELEKGN